MGPSLENIETTINQEPVTLSGPLLNDETF